MAPHKSPISMSRKAKAALRGTISLKPSPPLLLPTALVAQPLNLPLPSHICIPHLQTSGIPNPSRSPLRLPSRSNRFFFSPLLDLRPPAQLARVRTSVCAANTSPPFPSTTSSSTFQLRNSSQRFFSVIDRTTHILLHSHCAAREAEALAAQETPRTPAIAPTTTPSSTSTT